jgi:hypothetical protein
LRKLLRVSYYTEAVEVQNVEQLHLLLHLHN